MGLVYSMFCGESDSELSLLHLKLPPISKTTCMKFVPYPTPNTSILHDMQVHKLIQIKNPDLDLVSQSTDNQFITESYLNHMLNFNHIYLKYIDLHW